MKIATGLMKVIVQRIRAAPSHVDTHFVFVLPLYIKQQHLEIVTLNSGLYLANLQYMLPTLLQLYCLTILRHLPNILNKTSFE